ncbi:MAG: 50S ribosomal protein L17 [Anaerolineales bacterium]|nr:50S ribosomal protein L17 [Anaerolineales bacterium]MCS7249062.1 50S ribosomal protein L17 [Anaerolineales bacterium]MDW8162875.1 50S ribosomal protein L17 [Anaerolineales bacterium]MDW8446838.1 50S ribosomal protein L17 [Anaerolineales bacterium]
MRHRVAGYKLGRSKDHRKALRRNLVKELFDHGRIRTTRAKAEAVRAQAERLITLAKHGLQGSAIQQVHARRLAAARLADAASVRKLFDDIAPRFENRPGGYTRIVKLGPRLGDAAEMVMLELVEE